MDEDKNQKNRSKKSAIDIKKYANTNLDCNYEEALKYKAELEKELNQCEEILREKEEYLSKERNYHKKYYNGLVKRNQDDFKRHLKMLASKFCENVNKLKNIHKKNLQKMRQDVHIKTAEIYQKHLDEVVKKYELDLDVRVALLRELKEEYEDLIKQEDLLKLWINQKKFAICKKSELEMDKNELQMQYYNQEIKLMNRKINSLMKEWKIQVTKMKVVQHKLCKTTNLLKEKCQKARKLIFEYKNTIEAECRILDIDEV